MKKRLLNILLMTAGLIAQAVFSAEELSIKQQILMPGPLISGHAKYETQCETCHASFKKEAMATLCLDCHKDIASDRDTLTGFHGQAKLAGSNSCETCHKDHEGRNADIVGLLSDSFDHNATRFELHGAHQTVACTTCHTKDEKFREAEPSCISCHKDQDIHKGKLGEQCSDCHQSTNWQSLLAFDHDKTDFPLKGKHSDLGCSTCHIGQRFEFPETSCVSCHQSSDVHAGANGNECESCHRVEGWDKLSFDHGTTDFPLTGTHQDIPCRACHAPGTDRAKTPQTCNGCHQNADVHLGRNGDDCESCHNTLRWNETKFVHNRDTEYPLTGKHMDVGCTQCHAGKIHDPVPLDCAGCHIADDVHKDSEMAVCGTCHNTLGWNSISRFDHDFTSLPLIGMHQIVPCQSCHIGNQFTSTKSECVSCHLDDDTHKGGLGTECNACHTPNAWNIWQFDHQQATGYLLEGKHENVACDACHLPGSDPTNTPTACGSCHRSQDVHAGGFGEQCGRCHNTHNFFEIQIR